MSGSTQLASKLFAYVAADGSACPAAAAFFTTNDSDTGSPFPGDAKALTAATGVAITAGAYSESYSYTPTGFGPYTLCGYVNNSTGFGSSRFTIAAATLSAPADHVVGPQLNPQFAWQGGPNQTFKLIITSLGGTVATGDYWNLQPNDRGVAEFHVDSTGSGAMKLSEPLPPGTYSWAVVSRSPAGSTARSAARVFTVNGPRVKSLNVNAQAHAGTTSKFPGYTTLLIKTTAYANVTIQFTHEGRTGKITENWGKSGSGALTIKWTCAYPGVPYHYKVTATDSEGGKKVASGSFEPVSVARCASMKAAEQAAAQAQAQAQLQAAAAGAAAGGGSATSAIRAVRQQLRGPRRHSDPAHYWRGARNRLQSPIRRTTQRAVLVASACPRERYWCCAPLRS